MKQAQQIQCTQENCNIEVHQLHTHLLDENSSLNKITHKVKHDAHPIAAVVEDFVIHHQCANFCLLACVKNIHNLKGFTGDKTPGTRISQANELSHKLMESLGIGKEIYTDHTAGDEDDQDLDDDNKAAGEYGGLVQFLYDIPLN
ncbi:hypothetical protein PILCRDRAFT_17327 [Piloderma croceum F 1598]|jgi:hypothetical protein|uniref:Uncharacterized protein n=1 Tax=Piloderma croceum (strain F 1598) TaxID=765440 RepID=A0A0C3ETP2_PILCF|nr:hypothetical protein PILCRDRAFT_17327 [Piloderma croceum F 1598]